MNKLIDFFPTKLAKNSQFCNRIKEQAFLKRNIELTRHTVLVSPRRYGKSSLVHKVATDIGLPFSGIDLFLAHDDKTVIKRILVGISDVVSQLMPVTQKALTVVQQYFNNFKINLNIAGFDLELTNKDSGAELIEQLFDALKSLATMAAAKKKKVLLFIDEFQDITNAESAKAIQGAIRHIAQETDWVAFVFSGSSRHLLLDLFDDKSKPLYLLCDKMSLERMSSLDYYPHLQNAAELRWNKNIDETSINRILSLTELHPFYVNLLCHELWQHTTPPDINAVIQAWSACYEAEERRLIAELEKLTTNQQDILKALALNPVHAPMGQEFLHKSCLSLSSVRLGIKALLEKDMVYIIKIEDSNLPSIKKGQYRVLDPLLAYALRKYS